MACLWWECAPTIQEWLVCSKQLFFFFLQELEASLVCTGKRLDFKNINIHFSLALVVFVNKLNTSITKGALGSVPTGRQLLSSESILRIALFSICSCWTRGYGCFSALKVPTSLRVTPWSLHLWCFSAGLAVAHEPNEGLPHGPSVGAPPGIPDLAWWGFWSHSLVELSNGSWPLVSKRRAFDLQPPLVHEFFIFFQMKVTHLVGLKSSLKIIRVKASVV